MPSKTNKFRGGRTHGRGKKAGRGAGMRGGKGNAGTHKHKWVAVMRYCPDYFGRHGFKRPDKVISPTITINLRDIDNNLDAFVKQGVATKQGDKFAVDLNKLGIDKLLATGKMTKVAVITVDTASERAIEKVKASGGEVKLKE